MDLTVLNHKSVPLLYKIIRGYIRQYESANCYAGISIAKNQLGTIVSIMNNKGESDIVIDGKSYRLDNNLNLVVTVG